MSDNSLKLLNFIILSLTAHALLIFLHGPSEHYSKQRPVGQQWLSVSLSTIDENTEPYKRSNKLHKRRSPIVSHQPTSRIQDQNNTNQSSAGQTAHLIVQNTTQKESVLMATTKPVSRQLSIKSIENTQHTSLKEHKQKITTSVSDHEHLLTQQKAQRNFLLGQIQNRLLRYMYYPVRARKRGWEGEVTVSFHIDKNGNLDNIHLAQTSGYALLDSAALSAVRKVNNISVSQWGENFTPLALEVPVIYRLTNS